MVIIVIRQRPSELKKYYCNSQGVEVQNGRNLTVSRGNSIWPLFFPFRISKYIFGCWPPNSFFFDFIVKDNYD